MDLCDSFSIVNFMVGCSLKSASVWSMFVLLDRKLLGCRRHI
jgi:hypothetical protein